MNGRLISVCGRAGQLDLGLFGVFLQALQRQLVPRRSMPCSFLNSSARYSNDPLVEILTTEESIAVGRLHLEDAIADFKNRHVERAAAEIVNSDCAGCFLSRP